MRKLKSDLAAHLSMLRELHGRAQEFDIIHFHLDMLHFPIFSEHAMRTVTTLHGRLDLKDLEGAYRCWPEYPLVSISDHQRRPLADANWHSTIPHGLPADLYLPPARPEGDYPPPRVSGKDLAGRNGPTAPSRSLAARDCH